MKRTLLIAGMSLAVLLGASALLALAVGSEGEAPVAATPITISLTEMSFSVDGGAPNDTITFNAGETYAITFVNDGTVEHEMKAGNGAMVERANGSPDGYVNNFFSGPAVLTEDGQKIEFSDLLEVELDPGQVVTVEITVPDSFAGQSFEIGCFVPGHYEAGMKAPIAVK